MSLDLHDQVASSEAFSDHDWQPLDTGNQRLSDPRRRSAPTTAFFARRDRQVFLTEARRYRITWSNGYFELDDTPPARLQPLIKSIVSFCTLPANWDSYGARPVDPRQASAAISLLLNIVTAGIPLPAAVPTSHGGVQLEWHCNDIDLEIEIASATRTLVDFEDFRTEETEHLLLAGNLEPLKPMLARLSQGN